jgi:hypothetical protein
MKLNRVPWFAAAAIALSASAIPASAQEMFDDELFRKCYRWLVEGKGGALIDNLCLDLYGIPPPTLFICARKIQDGFDSEGDRKGCAFVFEDYARQVKASRIR